MKWENVYVFISSTFNDMHAERDYLIKRVFPELRIWCAERKLKLIDVDLRWGVSEADAQENKRVVEVCLKNIDKCRPFFLCFLGQRRGWIPMPEDVNPETLKTFPDLADYLGKNSVTELEIIHALLHPFSPGLTSVSQVQFYFRSSSYVNKITDKAVRQLFAPSAGLFSKSDRELEAFKKNLKKTYSVQEYNADWNDSLISPELVKTGGRDLSRGRLENFRVGHMTLKEHVLSWLQASIAGTFPEHMRDPESLTGLALELERQDSALFAACDSYITRPVPEQALLSYSDCPCGHPLLLLAQAGAGKTSLLAHLISEEAFSGQVYYRLSGITHDSSSPARLIASLLSQIAADGLLPAEEIEKPAEVLLLLFPRLLQKLEGKGKILFILDGIDQLHGTDDYLSWLPGVLPDNVGLIVSLKSDDFRQEDAFCQRGIQIYKLGQMETKEEKRLLIRGYLSQFLKDVDENQLEQIIAMPGSGIPLYLKIVLNELRQHGSFDTLMDKLRSDYGQTPRQAFRVIIQRLMAESGVLYTWGESLVSVFFGTLAFSLDGVLLNDYSYLFRELMPPDGQTLSGEEIMDAVYGLARQLSPFLAQNGGRVSFLYESLRLAAKDLFGSQEADFHRFLSGILRQHCNQTHQKEDYAKLLYHIIRMESGLARQEMTRSALLLDVLRYYGASGLSAAYYDGVSLGLTDFSALGDFFSKTAARLDSHPGTLFLELHRHGNPDDSLTASLLSQEKEQPPVPYLLPLNEPDSSSLLAREYLFPGSHMRAYSADSCRVLVSQNQIWIQNRDTLKLERLMEPENISHSLTVRKNFLFLLYRMRDCERLEVYTLPYLDRAFVIDNIQIPGEYGHTGGDYTAYDDSMLAAYQQENPDRSVDLRLIRFNTGEVIFHRKLTESFFQDSSLLPHTESGANVRFAGDYMILQNQGNGVLSLISLRDGSLAWEAEGPLGSDCSAAADDASLYIWANGPEQTEVFSFTLTENGPALIRRQSLPTQSGHVFLADHRLYLCSAYGLSVFGPDLTFLGSLPMRLSSFDLGLGCGLEYDNGYLLLLFRDRLRYYSCERILAALQPQPPAGKPGILRPSFILGHNQYVLTDPICKVDLNDMEETAEAEEISGAFFFYDTENIYSQRLLTGTNHHNGLFCIKDLEQMRYVLLNRFREADKEWLERLFLLDDNQPCLLTTDKETREQTVSFRTYEEKKNYTHARIHFLSLTQGLPEKDVWLLREQIPALRPIVAKRLRIFAAGAERYLLLPNTYVDSCTRKFCIYRISDRKCVCSFSYSYRDLEPADIHMLNIGPTAGSYASRSQSTWCCFTWREKAAGINPAPVQLHLFCLDDGQHFSICAGEKILGQSAEHNELYLADSKKHLLQICSITDHTIIGSIHTPAERRTNYCQALRCQDLLLLREYENDSVEVYEIASGRFLFRQRMEFAIQELMADEALGILCSLDSDGERKYCRICIPDDTK